MEACCSLVDGLHGEIASLRGEVLRLESLVREQSESDRDRDRFREALRRVASEPVPRVGGRAGLLRVVGVARAELEG